MVKKLVQQFEKRTEEIGVRSLAKTNDFSQVAKLLHKNRVLQKSFLFEMRFLALFSKNFFV